MKYKIGMKFSNKKTRFNKIHPYFYKLKIIAINYENNEFRYKSWSFENANVLVRESPWVSLDILNKQCKENLIQLVAKK